MEEEINQINQEKQTYHETRVKKFIESLGVECCKKTSDSIYSEIYNLNGYYYYCNLKDKWLDIIIDPTRGVYIRAPFYFSKADQVISKLSEAFGLNLNKLKFSELGFLGVFKLEPLPDEVINITGDDDEIDLSTTKNDRILINVRDKISLLYDKKSNKFIILKIKDWEAYNKIRDFIDQDVRETFDKLSSSKLQFILHYKYEDEKVLGLEGKIKENVLKMLNKLMQIVEKISKIEIRTDENEVDLNNLILKIKDESWDVGIPTNEIEKLLNINNVSIMLYKDFWFIKVHYDYLLKVASILNIEPAQAIHDIDPRKESLLFYEPRDYYIFSAEGGDYYHIVPSKNVEKYLQLLGVNTTQQSAGDSFEINDDYRYIIVKGQGDEIHIGVYKENTLLTSLRTYLWYFDVKNFDTLKSLDKEKILSIIRRQINERYFYSMPFDKVKQHVMKLVDNIIIYIDEAINSIEAKTPDFPAMVKDIVEINCLFDKYCEVTLELDETIRLSSYYSLIGTSEGHLPIPSFLEYVSAKGKSDEEDISIVKNVLYFIRGYKEIPEYEREEDFDDVKGAKSELFQKAVVLYNKLLNSNKLQYTEDDEYEEEECPENTLPDGMGYCRQFDYTSLMLKTEDELANEIIESLTEIKERMTKIRERIANKNSL